MLKNLETRTLVWAVPASVAFDSYRLLGFLAARNVAAARAYVRGTRRFLGLIPHILEERRRVQLTRLRSDRALMSEGVLAGVRQSSKEWRRINSLT
ncbi:MAG: hypothetical protein JOZ39_01640 [Chloroflexi bacterium]|nr:hypothetical protein [Chloroflexota bacterium]